MDMHDTIRMPESLIRSFYKSRFLVTGANGLIASEFIEALLSLDKEYDLQLMIYGLDLSVERSRERFKQHSGNPHLELLCQDVCEPLMDLEVDYIIHAASLAHPLAFSTRPVDVMRANIIGTINLLEAANKCKARLLFVSTGEVYGPNPDHLPAMEETYYGSVNSMDSRSCYPESKRAGETLCASYARQYQTDALVARLCYVYGPSITNDNSRADAQFLRNVLCGQDIVMKSEGLQKRTYCYVDDVIAAFLYILRYGKTAEAYNIANRYSIATIREYAQTLADIGGVSLRFDAPDEREQQGYSKAPSSVLDASKLEKLGWKPQYGLVDGLKKTYETALKQKQSKL